MAELKKFRTFLARVLFRMGANWLFAVLVFCMLGLAVSFEAAVLSFDSANWLRPVFVWSASGLVFVCILAALFFYALGAIFDLPERKLKYTLESAGRLAKEAPPEVSAKISSLVSAAESSKKPEELTAWIDRYKQLVGLEADCERIREEFKKLHFLSMKAVLLRKDLGLWSR